jgi:hypothetical protein
MKGLLRLSWARHGGSLCLVVLTTSVFSLRRAESWARRRMNKSQRMRWSRRGTDLLLQVHCAVLNGKFGSGFGQLFDTPVPASKRLSLLDPNRAAVSLPYSKKPSTSSSWTTWQ